MIDSFPLFGRDPEFDTIPRPDRSPQLRTACAWVRRASDLELACREMSAFFAFRQRRDAEVEAASLLGLWIGGSDASTPCELSELEAAETGARRVVESAGVSGIWRLAWLEGHTRESLFRSLVDLKRRDVSTRGVGHFAPVFSSVATPYTVSAELERLRMIDASALTDPLIQDAKTATLWIEGDRLRRLGAELDARVAGRDQIRALA